MGQIKHILVAGLMLLIAALGSSFIAKIKDTPSVIVINNTGYSNFCATEDLLTEGKVNNAAWKGKQIFVQNCASCHSLFKDGILPKLFGLASHEKWSNKKELLKWIQNPEEYMKNDKYTRGQYEKFGALMTPFPNFTMEDLEAVLDYLN